MHSIGFGTERLGLAALAAPRVATLIVALVTVLALFGATRLGFSGDVAKVLESASVEYENYHRLQHEFRDFSKDAAVLVQSPLLTTAAGIERLRDLHFELEFVDEVAGILSVFSVVRPAENGGWESELPAAFDTDAEVGPALERLRSGQPYVPLLLSAGLDHALMIAFPAVSNTAGDYDTRPMLRHLREITDTFADSDFTINFAGLPVIRDALVAAVSKDLILLSGVGITVSALIAYAVFRTVIGAIVCTLPPVFTVLWLVGAFGLSGNQIDFLTTVLPALVLVIAYADGLHLYFHWRKACDAGASSVAAMRHAVITVGPACALTAITTAVAFASLSLAATPPVTRLALIGAFGTLMSFVAVIVVLPLSAWWIERWGLSIPESPTRMLAKIGGPAERLARNATRTVVVVSTLLTIGLAAVHFNMASVNRLTDYLPDPSEVRDAEAVIDRELAGTSQIFAIVPALPGAPTYGPENRARIAAVHDTLVEALVSKGVMSLATFERLTDSAGPPPDIEAAMAEAPEELVLRFVSKDRSAFLVSGFLPAGALSTAVDRLIVDFETKLAAKGLEGVAVTGYSVLAARELPRLIDRLRTGLVLAVAMSIAVIALAMRSVIIAAACIVPNILPLFAVEACLAAMGLDLDITATIALTIAFGIAVDDSIHLVNRFNAERRAGAATTVALSRALDKVTPALVATTLVLCIGMMVTNLSSLPTAIHFGYVVIGTLLFALAADLFILPAMILTLTRASMKK